MAASYLREKCGFHLAFQGNQPKWSLRWRVGASENEWLHVAKKQTSTSNSWETWRRNLCYWSWCLQKTTSNYKGKQRCLPGDHGGHPKLTNQEILKYNNMSKCRTQTQLWTEVNQKRSQFSGPPTLEGATLNVPLPESATLSEMCVNGPIVYEWLDSAEEPGSSPPTKMPPTGRHLLPLVGGAWSPAGVSHVRESGWMGCVCLTVRAWLGVCKSE